MLYSNEQILQNLKEARKKKGLSQRELSAKSGVPQSHISKIESGGVDLRVSSLIALARALDLELELVPRKTVHAVKSIVRSNMKADNAATIKKAQLALHQLEAATARALASSAIGKMNKELESLSQLKSAAEFALPNAKSLSAMQNITKELERALASKSNIKNAIENADLGMRKLRNQIAHLPKVGTAALSAYRLEEGDDG